MRVKRMVALVGLAALAAPATAEAGGWATATVDSTPAGLRAGQPWKVEITVLQHGATPLPGVKPAIVVWRAGGGAKRTVEARPAGEPGVYRAAVTFPRAGRWRYVVDDGFGGRHAERLVHIRAPRAAVAPPRVPEDSGVPWWAIAAPLGAVLLAGGLTARRRARGVGSGAP